MTRNRDKHGRTGRLLAVALIVGAWGAAGCDPGEDADQGTADDPEVEAVQGALVVREVTDCAALIPSKKVRATLDISKPGVAQAVTAHRAPTGPGGTGGDWWAYASKKELADACNTAAYIRVKPHPTAGSLFFGVWDQADPNEPEDAVYHDWPTPDFCGHSTLAWALYGKSRDTGSWQLLVDPAGRGPVWTKIFGVSEMNGNKGDHCDHHEANRGDAGTRTEP